MALIDKASLLMVPSTYEAGKLYNVLPSGNRAPDSTDQNSGYDQTRADFDFDRGTDHGATRIDSNGVLQKYRENLFTESNNFSDSDWTKSGVSVTSGQSGYDETTNAYKIQVLTSGAPRKVAQTAGSFNGVLTLSVYAKAGTAPIIAVEAAGSNGFYKYFNLSTGTGGSQGGSIVDSSIVDVGSGWYRLSITGNPTTITSPQFFVCDVDNSTTAATGSNILIQNAQLESGLVSTDYLDSTSVTGKAGVLVDLPRINYDANGENGALLLEPSRSNSVPYSEGGFAYQTSTSGTGITPVITENAAISPEGVQNAFKVVLNRGAGNTSGDWSWIYQNNVTYYNGDNRVSVYLKAATSSDIGKEVFVRVASDGQAVTLTEDWKRHDFNRPTSGLTSDAGLYTRGGSSADNEVSFFVYGFQVEPNATYPSSYIPNHGESGGVTRAADLMYTGPTDLGGGSVGTLMVEIERIAIDTANTGAGVQLLTSSDNEEIRLHFDAPLSQVRWRDANNSYAQIGAVLSVTAGEFFKMCLVSDGTTAKAFGNGAQLGGDYSIVTAFDFDKLSLPQKAYKVKQIYFSNQALTDAEAITLTTL
jgi:hypothetical protein